MTISERTILVTGGTGQQGRAAVTALRRRGWQVRILTRDPASPAAVDVRDEGAQVVQGNLDDRASLDKAMAGVGGVFCVVPFVSFMKEGSFERQFEGTKNVIDAAASGGVDHFILSSANSADKGITSNLDNKFKMEGYARESGIRSTFLRPVAFMDNFALAQWGLHQGVFTSTLLPSTRQQLIAVDDIAELAAIMFEQPHESGARILEIAGDELTPGEMAEALSNAFGQRIPYVQVSADVLRQLNRNSAQGYARINAGDMTVIDLEAIRKLHPGLLTFADWLARFGAERLRPLLPQQRPGSILTAMAAWRLELPELV